jgi:uncharacterized YigZ family protein
MIEPMRADYRTLAGENRHEPPRIKGSRFIATATPVSSTGLAGEFVQRIRAEFSDARHTCFAWRLGADGEETRANDDGEPGGSAGRPILAQIVGHEVTDVAVTVTRWFGGVKLGVGGLMRAYGGATGVVLDQAKLRVVAITRRFEVVHPYDCSSAMQGLFAGMGFAPRASEYGASVRLEVDVPVRLADEFLREVRDRTAGRATIRTDQPDL